MQLAKKISLIKPCRLQILRKAWLLAYGVVGTYLWTLVICLEP